MSSRKEQKEQARAEREAVEKQQAADAAKKRTMSIVGGVVGLAVIAVLVFFVISASESGTSADSEEAKAANALYAGIPQNGNVLGEPGAKATIVEFADLRCPFCAQFEEGSMPEIVEQLVRTGKAKFIFRNLTMLDQASPSGADSTNAARYAGAAGLQNKLFPFVNIFFLNQGLENQDYATQDFLMDIGAQVDGLDAQKAWDQREDAAVTKQLEEANDLANEMNVSGTPTLFVGKDEASAKKIPMNDLDDPSPIIDAVDALQ